MLSLATTPNNTQHVSSLAVMKVNKQHDDLVTVTIDAVTVEIHGAESRLPETLCITHEARAEELVTIDLSPFTNEEE